MLSFLIAAAAAGSPLFPSNEGDWAGQSFGPVSTIRLAPQPGCHRSRQRGVRWECPVGYGGHTLVQNYMVVHRIWTGVVVTGDLEPLLTAALELDLASHWGVPTIGDDAAIGWDVEDRVALMTVGPSALNDDLIEVHVIYSLPLERSQRPEVRGQQAPREPHR